MSPVEVCLFDVSCGTLVPVRQGSVIWVRTELTDEPFESLSMSAARARVIFRLLQQMLEYEGRSGRFVIEPISGGCTVLKAFGELEPREERRLCNDPGGISFSAQVRGGERRVQLLLPLEPPDDTGGPESRDAVSGAASTAGEVIGEHGQPALLMYLLSEHYSRPLGDPQVGLREASARVDRIREVAAALDAHTPGPVDMDDRMRAFRTALARNLDTPAALRALFEWLRRAELRPERIGDSHLHEMLGLLSLDDVLEDLPAG